MADALSWLAEAAEDREQRGLRRLLTPRSSGPDSVLDLASNDYLALARHPAVIGGAVAAQCAYGAGSTGSRLVTGSTELHCQLEGALAQFVGTDAALVFSSGYTANPRGRRQSHDQDLPAHRSPARQGLHVRVGSMRQRPQLRAHSS